MRSVCLDRSYLITAGHGPVSGKRSTRNILLGTRLTQTLKMDETALTCASTCRLRLGGQGTGGAGSPAAGSWRGWVGGLGWGRGALGTLDGGGAVRLHAEASAVHYTHSAWQLLR